MGEIADMMLDGTLCEGCGEYIGLGGGYSQYCSPQCAADRGVEFDNTFLYERRARGGAEKVQCPDCGKSCKGEQGVKDHRRAKHKAVATKGGGL